VFGSFGKYFPDGVFSLETEVLNEHSGLSIVLKMAGSKREKTVNFVPSSLFSLVVYRKILSKEARNLLNFALSALSGLPVGGEFDLYLVLSLSIFVLFLFQIQF